MNNSKPVPVPPRHQSFEALDIALQAAGTAIALVDAVPARFRSLQDQIFRSAASVPSNVAEGNGRSGKDRTHFFRIALGLFDRVRAMLWKLVHR